MTGAAATTGARRSMIGAGVVRRRTIGARRRRTGGAASLQRTAGDVGQSARCGLLGRISMCGATLPQTKWYMQACSADIEHNA
jgi:hypothetical protein